MTEYCSRDCSLNYYQHTHNKTVRKPGRNVSLVSLKFLTLRVSMKNPCGEARGWNSWNNDRTAFLLFFSVWIGDKIVA